MHGRRRGERPVQLHGRCQLGNWPNVVRGAQKLDVAYVLPGHGGPGGKEVLEGEAQFMTHSSQEAVGSAVKQGKKLTEHRSGRDENGVRKRGPGCHVYHVTGQCEELGGVFLPRKRWPEEPAPAPLV